MDIRADLYSLGCTLYKLLSGRAPFSGPKYQDQVSKLMAHAREPVPPIRKLRPDVPAQVAAVLDRLLAKDPAQRYATPAELLEAITLLAGGSNLRALAARARKSSAAPRRAGRRSRRCRGVERACGNALQHRRPVAIRCSPRPSWERGRG